MTFTLPSTNVLLPLPRRTDPNRTPWDGPAEVEASSTQRDPPDGPREWCAQAAAVKGLGS